LRSPASGVYLLFAITLSPMRWQRPTRFFKGLHASQLRAFCRGRIRATAEVDTLGSAAYIGWTERDHVVRIAQQARSRTALPSARNPKSHFEARGTPGTVERAHEVGGRKRIENQSIDAGARKGLTGR
jgi:hypothetical protein